MLCIHSIPTYLAICFALLLGTTSAAPAPGPSPVQKPFSSFPNSQSLVSASIPRTRFCGQQPNKNKTNDDLARTLVSARRAQIFATHDVTGLDASRQLASQNKMVPVVWHVVTDGGTGNLTMGQIEAQVEGLNSDCKYASPQEYGSYPRFFGNPPRIAELR